LRDDRRATVVGFCCALLPTLIFPVLVPKLRLTTFAPFLVLVLYQKTLVNSLWWALAIGCLLDLLSGYPRMGLLPLTYCLTIAALTFVKPYFFIEKFSTLPLMTMLFALLSTLILFALMTLFGQALQVTWRWIATDLLFFPLLDGLYGLVWFAAKWPRRNHRGSAHADGW
jgi:hypothetical protein